MTGKNEIEGTPVETGNNVGEEEEKEEEEEEREWNHDDDDAVEGGK